MTEPSNFKEFWPDYLRAHSDPRSRALHIAGTAAGAGCTAMFVLSGRPRWLLAALASAYGSAWMGHFLFQKNTPTTFSHPLWSLRGDLRMVRMAVAGTLDEELRRTGIVDQSSELVPEQKISARVQAGDSPTD
jgi:hypothetical protein